MHPDRVTDLGSAVLHWLCFQALCGRSALLCENYLNQPIGEFLLHHHSGKLESEVNHPSLNQAGRRGRPRQVDFCLKSRDTQRITSAFELKWVSDGPFDKQRVVDDLLRLEALRIAEAQHVYRYFLVAGKMCNFDVNFTQATANLGGGAGRVDFFLPILDFATADEKVIDVGDLDPPQRGAFDEFANYYQSPLPRRLITQRVVGQSLNGFSVYIWRVRSVQHRRTFPLPAPPPVTALDPVSAPQAPAAPYA
jgi:hypothetical protein